MPDPSAPPPLGTAIRKWFLRPPRPHGQVLEDRVVGNLELFYDLVFVVFIGRLAHHLAEHVTGRGMLDFAVLFAVMWVAWFNGSVFHELHGREDGRARTLIFAQMLLLALLAVEADEAGGEHGGRFAAYLAALLVIQTYQWWTVYRLDEPQFRRSARRYLIGSWVVIGVTVAAALVDDPNLRLALWAGFLVVAVGGTAVQLIATPNTSTGLQATESMSERLGLFVIIVLGEIVVGVVDGLSATGRDAHTVATALLALTLGFGFWWTYFDLVGERLPFETRRAVTGWLLMHLPLSLAIAAAGAGMVGLVEHAHESHTPQATAWLVAGAVAGVLLVTAVLSRMVASKTGNGRDALHLRIVLALGAAAALAVGALHPAPWLLGLALLLVLVAIWWFAFVRWLQTGGAATLG